MALEHLADVVLFVLAHDDEQQASLLEVLEVLLKELKAAAGPVRSELDSAWSRFPDDAAPERVVAVERDHFCRRAARGPDLPHERDGNRLVRRWRIRCARQRLALAVSR